METDDVLARRRANELAGLGDDGIFVALLEGLSRGARRGYLRALAAVERECSGPDTNRTIVRAVIERLRAEVKP